MGRSSCWGRTDSATDASHSPCWARPTGLPVLLHVPSPPLRAWAHRPSFTLWESGLEAWKQGGPGSKTQTGSSSATGMCVRLCVRGHVCGGGHVCVRTHRGRETEQVSQRAPESAPSSGSLGRRLSWVKRPWSPQDLVSSGRCPTAHIGKRALPVPTTHPGSSGLHTFLRLPSLPPPQPGTGS